MTLKTLHLFNFGAVLKEYYREASECRIPMDMFMSFLGILTAKNIIWQFYKSESYVNGDIYEILKKREGNRRKKGQKKGQEINSWGSFATSIKRILFRIMLLAQYRSMME
jgi:hypothetical protein